MANESVPPSALEEFYRGTVAQVKKAMDAFEDHRKQFISASAGLGGLPDVKPFQRAYEEGCLLTLYRGNVSFREEARGLIIKYQQSAAKSNAESVSADGK